MSVAEGGRRPWPVPRGPWAVAQTWNDLLLAHWPVPADLLRPLVPHSLDLDAFEGRTWVSVVAFQMSGAHIRWTPLLPGIAAYPQLNVRTYVTRDERPGVFFLDIEAGSRAAVYLARSWFALPYHYARMAVSPLHGALRFFCRRAGRTGPHVEFRGWYRPTGPAFQAEPGTLDHWLTERYCLYTPTRTGRMLRAEIGHVPWDLHQADAAIAVNTVTRMHGIALSDRPARMHYARRMEVVIWPPSRVGTTNDER